MAPIKNRIRASPEERWQMKRDRALERVKWIREMIRTLLDDPITLSEKVTVEVLRDELNLIIENWDRESHWSRTLHKEKE